MNEQGTLKKLYNPIEGNNLLKDKLDFHFEKHIDGPNSYLNNTKIPSYLIRRDNTNINIYSHNNCYTFESKSQNNKKYLNRVNLIKTQLSSKTIGLPSNITIQDNIWNGFHKKLVHERLLHIKKINKDVDIEKLQNGGLNLVRADSMIENCIGIISIPVGLGLNFTINSHKYVVPMAVEEPSIIAAVSTAAKLISENGGFVATSDQPLMISQVHIIDTDTNQSSKIISDNKDKIISFANKHCQEMVQRGGGVQGLYIRVLKKNNSNINNGMMIVELIVNVCESMGANLLNTIAEKTGDYIETFIEGRVILKILSNLAVFRKAKSEFKIPISNLKYKGLTGEELAERILKAYEIAKLDPFRTATHNKGIMNGIDAVALALGQDWRAIEAGAHTYSAINETTFKPENIKPMTYFQIIKLKGISYLYGNLTLPLAVGVVGGAIKSNENYSNLLRILGNPSAAQLSQIIVSVGLAQNFAALRALVSEGIQKGHMGLHAKNIAHAAGVPDYILPDVVNFMKQNNSITERTAKKYLESHNFYTEMRKCDTISDAKNLSTFYIEMEYQFLKEPIIMNILLNNKIDPPIHFSLGKVRTDDIRIAELFNVLFGKQQTEDWLIEFIKLVHHFDFSQGNENLSNILSLKYKVKMIIILFYVIVINLMKYEFNTTKNFLEKMFSKYNYDEMLNYIPNEPIPITYGLSVVLEFYEIMRFYLNNYVKDKKIITNKIFSEIENSITGFIKMYDMVSNGVNLDNYDQFFEYRIKRLNATNMILADLAFSQFNIDEDLLECFLALGKYCEINLTILRDYAKHKEGGLVNSYVIFQNLLKENVQNEYFNLRVEERSSLKNKFSILNNKIKRFQSLIDNMEEDISRYYKISELEPKF